VYRNLDAVGVKFANAGVELLLLAEAVERFGARLISFG
jgi:hypothetical protein